MRVATHQMAESRKLRGEWPLWLGHDFNATYVFHVLPRENIEIAGVNPTTSRSRRQR